MVVGLPGTGIGGLFYLLASTWMPVQETLSATRKPMRFSRWRTIGRLVLITVAVAAGFWATGHLIGVLLVSAGLSHIGINQHAMVKTGLLSDCGVNVLSANLLYWALVTLAGLYLAMQALRLLLRLSRVVRVIISP